MSISSLVAYGTFITNGHWKNKLNVKVCIVENFVRIFPKGNWFPYVLPSKNSSFKALKFDINEEELKELDRYEGVQSGLFKRVEIEVLLKGNTKIKAFIYIPTEKTINSLNLSPKLDKNDLWIKEIEKFPEIVKKFPELVMLNF